MKVVKAKSKARESSISKLNNFFTSFGSFGAFYSQISLFLSFKAIKAKKAALVAGNANLHWGIFLDSKLLFYYPKELFKLPLTQNWADKQKLGILEAQMCPKGHKIEEFRVFPLFFKISSCPALDVKIKIKGVKL